MGLRYADLYALLESIVDDCFSELFRSPVFRAKSGGSFEKLGLSAHFERVRRVRTKKELYQQLLFGRTNTQLMQRLTNATVEERRKK